MVEHARRSEVAWFVFYALNIIIAIWFIFYALNIIIAIIFGIQNLVYD